MIHHKKMKDLACAHAYTETVSNKFNVIGTTEDPREL